MATTAAITIASDIYSGFSGITKSMTLTKAGTTNDLEETTGFSRRKLTGTTAVDLIVMADLQVETTDSKAAKVYIKNIGDGKGNIAKDKYVAIGLGTVGSAGTTADYQEISKLYGGDWMLIPVTGIDATSDIQATAETDDAVVLEYVMFFE
jgi:hypothetical protein